MNNQRHEEYRKLFSLNRMIHRSKKTFFILSVIILLFGMWVPENNNEIVISNAKAATHTLNTPSQNGATISLTWTNDSSATGYHIYRTTNQGSVRLTGSTPLAAGTTIYNDSNNIKDGVIYQYEVAALISGEEIFSNSQSIFSKTPPTISPDPIIATPGSNFVDLTFSASPSVDVAYFEIYRDGSFVGTTTGISYRDITVTPAKTYLYTVKAVDRDGLKSNASAGVSTTTLAAVATTQTKIYLNTVDDWSTKWTEVNDNSKNILTFSTLAKWSVTGRGQDGNAGIVYSELTTPFSILTGEAGGNLTINFDWEKAWGNTDKSNGEKTDLKLEYQYNNGAWTNISFPDATTLSARNATIKGQGVLTIPGNAGNYKIRFKGDIYSPNSGKGDYAWMTVDNVEISKSISNTAPSQPASLTAQSDNSNLVNLNWTAPLDTDLIGYKVFRKLATDTNYPTNPLSTVKGTSFSDATAVPNTNYSYKIIAVDSGNLESGAMEAIVQTPAKSAADDTTPPVAPVNLTSSSVGSASVEVHWEPSTSNDLKEYLLLRSIDQINYSVAANLSTLTTIDKRLQADTNYYYRVIAIDSNGNPSAPSNRVKARTSPPDTQAPTTPVSFEAETIGETYVKFKWEASTDNDRVERYEIEKYENGWIKAGEFLSPSLTGSVDRLIPGTDYKFRIKAYDTSNNASSEALLPGLGAVTTKVDTSPPKVLFKMPANKGIDVGTKEYILIRFDDIIKPSSVGSSTVKLIYNPPTASLTMAAGETITGTYSTSPDTNPTEIIFTPTEPLQQNTTYGVEVNGVTNISGTQIEPVTWAFTTGDTEYTKPHGNYTETTVYCSFCHSTHTAAKPKLLESSVQGVCFSCHNGTGSSLNIQNQFEKAGITKKSHHPTLENMPGKETNVQLTCVSCHNPHDGEKDLDTGVKKHLPSLLTTINKGNASAVPPVPPTAAGEGNEVCWNCHGNEGALINSKGYAQYSQGYIDGGEMINPPFASGASYDYRTDHQRYYPVGKGHASTKMDTFKGEAETKSGSKINCVACHERHGSDVAPLLRNNINAGKTEDPSIVNGKEYCYQCHESSLDLANADNTVPATKSYDGEAINEARGHSQFDCQVCHNPHGSPYPNYLRLNYRVDTSSWRNFNAKDAELCFDCHDQTKLLNQGAALRGRTDRGNLHGFHLSSEQATCKNCHRPHGSIDVENGNTSRTHSVGFPNQQVSGSKTYNRNAAADDSMPGGSGSCSLNCHGRDHSDFNYDGAFRDGTGISNFSSINAFMLKDDWKTSSVLLNTRPDGTGVYDMGEYKIDYRNGPVQGGFKSHFRDADGNGFK